MSISFTIDEQCYLQAAVVNIVTNEVEGYQQSNVNLPPAVVEIEETSV